MTIQIEVNPKQVNTLISLLEGKSELEIIKNQLIGTKYNFEDHQLDEVPAEGDNGIIERTE